MLKTYRRLPDIPSGYPLEAGKSWFSVIVPIARTNEVTNPSAELAATTGYTAGAGTLTTTTLQQYHGARAFQYTPSIATTDGFYYTLTSTVAIRAISCKFKGQAGIPYALTYSTSAGVDLVTKPFVATSRWQWIHLYYNDASATTRRIYFRKNGGLTDTPYYVDGVQSEIIQAGELVSTYIDGDQLGLVPNQSPPAYYWTGTPHASTSVRSGLTRAGGMVIPMSKYGFLLTAIIGLGLAVPQNVATEYARIDGGFDDYTRKPTRQFSLTGRFQGNTAAALDRYRGGLSALLDRDLIGQDQRLTLRYEKLDQNGNATSDAGLITAKYESGLGGNSDNLHAETAAITFTQNLPLIMAEGSGGAALNVQLSVTDADYILKRSAAGVWSALGTGITGVRVYALLVARSGRIYVGGNFTSAGGVANTNHIAYFDPSDGAWHAMATGVSGGNEVFALCEMPDGRIIVGGGFTAMSGVANTLRLAAYTPASNTWAALSTGANNSVLGLTVGATGLLYLGGSFTSIGGVAADRLASWNGAAFSALSTGANSPVTPIITGKDGKIYFGGSFTSPGNRVAVWNPSTAAFETLGSGLAGTASALAFAPNGKLYAAGDSTSGYLNAWNGVTWTQLITTFTGTGPIAMQALSTGELWVGGSFGVSSLPSLNDGLVKVLPNNPTGSATLLPVGIDLPGTPGIYAIAQSAAGDLYIGYDSNGTAVAEAATTITNTGTARSYPTVVITGPSSGSSRIYQIINPTTGRAIYFNYVINAGETATLVFQPDSLSFQSDIQGNLGSKILAGSNEADFFLQPGANTITFLSASSTVTASISWRPNYARLDDMTR